MFDRDTLQRAISFAYRTTDFRVPGAVGRINEMVEMMTEINPQTAVDLHTAALMVIEEFSDEPRTNLTPA